MIAFRLTILTSLCALPLTGALAQDIKTPSFAELTASGFEIRAVTPIAVEDRAALVADGTTSALFVTLQRGGQTAVCQFATANWINVVPASLESTANLCSVYPPVAPAP